MRDFLLQEIEAGDILIHVSGSVDNYIHICIALGSMTQGGKIRVCENWYGRWNPTSFKPYSVIKINEEKLNELLLKLNGLARVGNNQRGDMAYQLEYVVNKSREIKNR